MQHLLPCVRRTFQQNNQRLSVALDVFDLRGEVLFRHDFGRCARQNYCALVPVLGGVKEREVASTDTDQPYASCLDGQNRRISPR